MKASILRALSGCRDELIEFAQDLIEIPTENPPGRHYRECTQLIGDRLRAFGVDSRVIEVGGSKKGVFPRYCLLACYGPGEEKLYFHGHYDVVPASSESQFAPVLIGNRLVGRGSSDMKGGIAAMIYAIRILQMCDIRLRDAIGLRLVPDEETGGEYGSLYLLKRGLLGKDALGMLIPEPTGGRIWNASRGAVSMMVTVRGKMAHAALQYKGVNAFENMTIVADELLRLKSQVEKRRTNFNIEPETAKHSILMLGGLCRGGTNFNIVPAECSFTIERRINPEETLESEKQRIFDLFEHVRKKGIRLDYEVLQEGESAVASERSKLAEALCTSVKTITGKRPGFQMCPGLLETRFYAKRNIPSYAYGPGALSVAHGPREWVDVEKICRCAAVYALTAAQLLGVSER